MHRSLNLCTRPPNFAHWVQGAPLISNTAFLDTNVSAFVVWCNIALTVFLFPYTETTYKKYKRKRTEKWTELRPLMAIALVEENSPEYFECTRCSEPTFEEYVRCLDCGPLAVFCPDCCAQHHAVIGLHKPERWKVSLHCEKFTVFKISKSSIIVEH